VCCFLQAIPLLTRQLAKYSSIGAAFPLRIGKSGTVVFDVKANRCFKTCGWVKPVAQRRKADCRMATGL
jgi:hypothetical protein